MELFREAAVSFQAGRLSECQDRLLAGQSYCNQLSSRVNVEEKLEKVYCHVHSAAAWLQPTAVVFRVQPTSLPHAGMLCVYWWN